MYVHIVHLGQTRTTTKTISCALACLRSSHAYSVTFDNGKEFSEHRRITEAGIETYFADPYKSIQRARNENTNGLIRQYLPKSSSFDEVSNEQIEQIEFALNHRPRKTLGWYTPSEVMAGFILLHLLLESADKKEADKKEIKIPAVEPTAVAVPAARTTSIETPQQQQMKLYVAARRDINSGKNSTMPAIMPSVPITMANYRVQKEHVSILNQVC